MTVSQNLLRENGFTMIELTIVIFIVGILAAIAAPFGLGLLERSRTTSARDEVYVAMRQAQDKAQQEMTPWQFAIRQQNEKVEWITHPGETIPISGEWQRVGTQSLVIDAETNLAPSGTAYYVRFDERGNVQHRLGRITLSSKNFPKTKRCVVVSTLIGTMRKSEERPVAQDGKFCY
jgi:prepilin-type N-terminal cleavage/methylation domain-containing protein